MRFLTMIFCAFLTANLWAQTVPRQAWTVDTEDLRMRNLSMIYGETLDLECTFRNYFSALDIEGASVTLHARTNGMDAAESYQVTGYSEAGGKAVVRVDVDAWLPQGLDSVDYTLAVVRAGTTRILRAFGTVYLRGSNAAAENAPVPVSVYAVLESELTNHIAWAEAEISALQSGLANALKPSDTNGYLRLPDLPDEADPRAMRLFHYGDPDIVITPTNFFGFNPATGTITSYSASGPIDVVIPYEIGGVPVTSIGNYAFIDPMVGGFPIKTVIAPKTVTSIGDSAFGSCGSLTSVDFPAVTSIENYAFVYCDSLTNITTAANAPTVGTGAFSSTHANLVITVNDPQATGWRATLSDGSTAVPVVRPALHGGEVYSGGEPVLTASTFLPPFTNMLLFADGGTNYYPRWDHDIGTFIVTGVPQ